MLLRLWTLGATRSVVPKSTGCLVLGFAQAVAAMEAEATVDVMMQTIHAHPTLYEALGEAFNAVYGLSINA